MISLINNTQVYILYKVLILKNEANKNNNRNIDWKNKTNLLSVSIEHWAVNSHFPCGNSKHNVYWYFKALVTN